MIADQRAGYPGVDEEVRRILTLRTPKKVFLILISSSGTSSGIKSLLIGHRSLLQQRKLGPDCQNEAGPISESLTPPLVARSAGLSWLAT